MNSIIQLAEKCNEIHFWKKIWIHEKSFPDTPGESSKKRVFKGSIFQKSAKESCKKRHIFPKFLQKKDTTPGPPPPLYSIPAIYIYLCIHIVSSPNLL